MADCRALCPSPGRLAARRDDGVRIEEAAGLAMPQPCIGPTCGKQRLMRAGFNYASFIHHHQTVFAIFFRRAKDLWLATV